MKTTDLPCPVAGDPIPFAPKFDRLFMRRSPFALPAILACLLAFARPTSAQNSVTTDPVGFTTTSLVGNSDTYISIPFARPIAFNGAVQSISGTPMNTITVVVTPGWTNNQFVYAAGMQPNHYYILIGSGGSSNPKQGHTFAVTANGSNTLTVNTSFEDLSGITANTQVVLIPNWTPNTLFPATNANVSFTPTTSPPTYKTLIQVPNYAASGINLGYATTYYFSQSNSRWQIVNDNTNANHGDDALLPDGYLVIENANGAPTLPLTNLGAVILKQVTTPLLTSSGGQQDNPVGMARPFDIALDATGLGPANGSFGANDQLLVFDNMQAALNKSPAAIYYYDTTVGNSGGWRLTGDSRPNDRGSDIIPMGTGFVVRKAQAASGQPAFWTNSFPVQAVSAVSRKVHGSAGTFDLTLPLNLQFNSRPGIESRVVGSTPAGTGIDHQIVLTFPTAVSFSNIVPTSGAATVDSFSGNNSTTVTINLKSVANAQKTTITLLGVNDGTNTNDVAVQMGLLLGDVNGDGFVLSGDYTTVRKNSGNNVDQNTFKYDINADGFILSGDYTTVRKLSGTQLP